MTDGTAGAPLERPARHSVLLELEREVAASPSDVFELLVRRIAPTDGQTHFGVYPDQLSAVLQGDWWYRGEFRVTSVPAGAKVSYAIVNVAQKKRRLGTWIGRKTVAAAPEGFARHLDRVEDELRTR
ncbi:MULTISPECIES: hypothetical protein [unclassified Streptomyces]|uniref:hypothetical protein n=1 Tax=unclassified Streptomyces TaxID=2593676 RepID=UPI002E18729F|nr:MULTISPECIES: hypothetical protein [unclassified Streptomyces]